MKRFGLAVLAVAFVSAPAMGQDIDQIQASAVYTQYTAADEHLAFSNDTAGYLLLTITLADSTVLQNELISDPVNFYLDGYLYDDRSSGGILWGRFNDGTFNVYWDDVSTGDIYSLDGPLIAMEIKETSECIFDGSGQFTIDNAVLPAGITWPTLTGSVATFTFVPTMCENIDDWSQDISGIGYSTVVPNGSGFPEPVTLLLLGGLALAARRRR
jgi:hypothetical protein